MLLDTETAVKVAHDIIHDAEEFIGHPDEGIPGKWAALLGTSADIPSGHVDFEFSDGYLLGVPCVWQVLLYDVSPTRDQLTIRRNGESVTLRPVIGELEDMAHIESDGPMMLGGLFVDTIYPPENTEDPFLYVHDAQFGSVDIDSATASYCHVDALTINGSAIISSGIFENMAPSGNGHVDASLSSLDAETLSAYGLICGGEQVVPAEKVNAWLPSDAAPKTDAIYSGNIPVLPLDAGATPINGFGNPLEDNPFFPDWFYVANVPGPWRARYAWVPSLEMPSGAAWRDSDGIYWHLVSVVTNAAAYGSAYMVFPPRCRNPADGDLVVPPMRADADGLIINVKHMDDSILSYVILDRYEYQDDNTWRWYPGRTVSIKGPCIRQFVAKRQFTMVSGRIVAVEYQLLPLGEVDVNP